MAVLDKTRLTGRLLFCLYRMSWFMARIVIEDYDGSRHRNHMWYVDTEQAERHHRAPTLVPYKVCLVTVCNFTLVFHSVLQLSLCLEYYSREHQPSSRDGDFGCDHWECQRW